MNDIKKTPTILKNRKRILEAAKKVFLANGIGESTIKMIAEEANLSLKTIFNYYANKDMIAVDLQMELLATFGSVLHTFQMEGETPLEKIAFFFQNFVNLNEAQIEAIKFITAFDYYYVRGYPTKEYGAFIGQFMSPFNFLVDLIKWGQAEGSIVSGEGYDPFEIYLTIMNSTYAYVQKFHYRDNAIKEEGFPNYMGNPKVLIDIILRGLKK